MKLINLEVFVVGNKPPGWGGRYFIFVKLSTDTGIVGYGEVYARSLHVVVGGERPTWEPGSVHRGRA